MTARPVVNSAAAFKDGFVTEVLQEKHLSSPVLSGVLRWVVWHRWQVS